MFSKRRTTPYVPVGNLNVITSKELICSEFREESPVDQFLRQEIEVNGVPSVRLTSDIYMLFNQRRLDKLSRESLLSHFESMSVNEPKFGDLRAKLGDDQLINFVKSRFIQSPSELMAWSSYLMSSSDAAIAELAALQEQSQTSSQSTEESSASTE
ncbi:hypothetical protein [Bacteroides thetaiotaomicron]|uniref:hypothetical protein n=1 Tax=Bacteroides thetaiotaomicron TaxID=818 RepID=UPI0039B649FF